MPAIKLTRAGDRACRASFKSGKNKGEGGTHTENESSGAPRTVHPRQSIVLTDATPPGPNSQPNRAESSVARTEGHRKGRSDQWSKEEEDLLISLYRRFEGVGKRKRKWEKVWDHFSLTYPKRTMASLKKRFFTAIKKNGTGDPLTETKNQPTEGKEERSEDVGEGVGTSEDPTRGEETEVSPDPRRRTQSPQRVTDDAGIVDTNNVETPEVVGEEETRFWAFRKAFYGYFRWAVNGFDREPLKRIGKDCPEILFAYADRLIHAAYDARGPNQSRIGRLNALVYAAGRAIYQFWKEEVNSRGSSEMKWSQKIRMEVTEHEDLISKIEVELKRRKEKREISAEERSALRCLRIKLGTRATSMLVMRLEQAKQRLSLLKDRITLREQEKRRKQLRKRFAETPSLKTLRSPDAQGNEQQPSMDSIMEFWKGIIGTKVGSKPDEVEVLRRWKADQQTHYRERFGVDEMEVEQAYEEAIRMAKPWKAVGPDGIQAFWLKNLSSAKRILNDIIKDWLITSKVTTGWLCRGRTVLIPKKRNSNVPADYRPITCLNTCYKIMTAVINKITLNHLKSGTAIPESQRALKKSEWGCTHAIIKDNALIMDAASQRKRPISVAWVDYRKAFDSVSHEYIEWLLEAVNIPTNIRTVLRRLMGSWTTRFEISRPGLRRGKDRSDQLRVLNGIFQGDSLSPTLFILAIAPVSYALETTVTPCRSVSGWKAGLGFELSHQFYVDDLKLYARYPAQLTNMLRTVTTISEVLGLRLNKDKCAQAHFNPSGAGESMEENGIPVLGFQSTYKYLGIEQHMLNDNRTLERVESDFFERSREIFGSDLTWGQKAHAYNTIAIAAMRYVYANLAGGPGKLSTSLNRARRVDTKIREILKECKTRFKASCTSRLYLPGEEGGYGLASAEEVLEDSIMATWSYLTTQSDLEPHYHLMERLANRGKRSIVSDASKVMSRYGICPEVDARGRSVTIGGNTYGQATSLHRRICSILKKSRIEAHLNSWGKLTRAGQFCTNAHIDRRLSSLWIKRACISARNLRDVLGVQEGCLLTRSTPASVNMGNYGTTCRCCHAAPETPQHVVSNCVHWLPNLYVERHNAVARNVHFVLCTKYGLPPTHYSNQVPHVLENERCKLLWDLELQTRVPMKHRRPDLVLFDKELDEILVLEISVPFGTQMSRQREIKVNRYVVNSTDLDNETTTPYAPGINLVGDLQGTYKQRTHFLPVIVGCCGEFLPIIKTDIMKKMRMNSDSVERLLERMARSAALGTARIVRAHMACQ